MPLIEWDEEYGFGIEELDNQHKLILERLNFDDAIRAGEGDRIVEQLIVDLMEYTREHFRTEEELFEQHGYPKAGEQKIAHREFLERVEGFYAAYQRGERVIPLEVMVSLKDWIHNHLLTQDMEYRAYFMRLGLG